MSIVVDPDNYNAVINAQHEWLKTLQSKQPKAQILIKAIEGKTPVKADYNFCGWLPNLYFWHKLEETDVLLAKKMFQAFDYLFYVIIGDIGFVRGDI